MAKMKDLNEEVGKAIKKEAAKEIAKAVTGEQQLTGSAKDLNDIIEEAIASQVGINLHVSRTNTFGKPEFLNVIRDVPPSVIKEQGFEPIIQQWSGGGQYTVRISGPGIPTRTRTFNIAGDPLKPKPERENASQTPFNPAAPFPTGGGAYQAGPAFGNYLGFPGGGSSGIEHALLGMVSQFAEKRQQGPDPQVEELKEQMRKNELARLEAERKVEEARKEAEYARQRAEDEKKWEARLAAIEKANAQPKTDTATEVMKAIAPVATALVPAFIAYKQDEVKRQMDMAQRSDQRMMELFSKLSDKPSQEERMGKVMDGQINMMGNVMGMMGSMAVQLKQLEGDNPPMWAQLLTQGIEIAGNLGGMMLENQAGMSEEQYAADQPAMQTQEAYVEEPAQLTAAQRAAQGLPEAEIQEASQQSGVEIPNREDFDEDLKEIFDIIEKQLPVQEVAYRLGRLVGNGHAFAVEWFKVPEEVTLTVLGTFVEKGQMDVTDEYATALVNAIIELQKHFASGGTPEAYATHYGIVDTPTQAPEAPTAESTQPVIIEHPPLDEDTTKQDVLMAPELGNAQQGGKVVYAEPGEHPEGAVVLPLDGVVDTESTDQPEKSVEETPSEEPATAEEVSS